MADIVSSLFGPSPWEIQQQQRQQQQQQAAQFAQMNAAQRGAMGMYQAGGQLGGMLAEGMGMENPAVAQAKMREQALGGLDMSSPEAILQRAQQIQDPRIKMQLQMLAQQKMAERQKMKLEAQKGALSERKQDFAEKEAFDLKKMEAEARIRQNDQRIADARTTAQERMELMRENNQIKMMLGQMMNETRRAAIDAKTDAVNAKGAVKADKAAEAKAGLSATLDDLQASYDSLNQEKGLPSTQRGALSNIGSYTASSGVGQLAGRVFGTKEQSQRDMINSSRMLLLNDIKNATGMSAQQMNSNVELQNWLKALGDPTVGYETATSIISNIRKKYVDGVGAGSIKPAPPAQQPQPTGAVRKYNPATGRIE